MIRFLAFWLIMLAGMILVYIVREERLAAKGKVPTGRLRRIWMKSERRRAPRYRIDWSIHYERISNGNHANGKTWDVSTTGAALILPERLEPGITLKLDLAPAAGGAPVSVSGKIMWVRPIAAEKAAPEERLFLTGIQFEKLDAKMEHLLLKEMSGG